MTKLIVYFLLFFGVLFIFLYRPAGILFLAAGLLVIFVFVSGRDVEILERWTSLIREAQGQGDKLMLATKEHVVATKAPSLEMIEEAVGPSLSKTTFGETRKFLIVINKIGLKFRSYKIFVNANDYGNNLFVSWYLTYKPDWWQSVMLLMPGVKEAFNPRDLNLFDQQDLTAYVTNVHYCFLAAVDRLLLELHQDPTKLDRRSRGFLGIS